MNDEKVSATIFELLVGAACVRRGLDVTMVAEDRSRKVPDHRIDGIGSIPGAIECKRRIGLTSYERAEAAHVEVLYSTVRPSLQSAGIHGSVEVRFRIPVRSVTPAKFTERVLSIVGQERDQEPIETPWGWVGFRRTAYSDNIPATRLYSPDYLDQVFDWLPLQDEWDGLVCEVEPPSSIGVKAFRMPVCLKWRSESEEALTKKARGITSLWVDAVRQIPDGEIGFVYIAYPEGARPAIADARTRHILQKTNELWHRWSVRVPVTVISRLYARSLGSGSPDFIESAMPGVAKGGDVWLTMLPVRVFNLQDS
jgi:hypothetical protein